MAAYSQVDFLPPKLQRQRQTTSSLTARLISLPIPGIASKECFYTSHLLSGIISVANLGIEKCAWSRFRKWWTLGHPEAERLIEMKQGADYTGTETMHL